MRAASVRTFAALGACLLSLAAAPSSAQQGVVLAGVLVNDATGEPLSGGAVSLIGTDVRVATDEDGRFLIEGLPEGPVRVRFEAPGHVSVLEDVEASVGAFFRVPLSPVAAVLDEILVSAGRSRRGQDGAQALTVDRDAEGWRSILDLLDEQVPGVVVRRGGGLGGGAHLSIRGAGTLTGDVAPDVYLDGNRIDSRNAGTWSLHTLDLISAEDVDRVRVYKGASGGAGLVLGGANGAIVIETNRGQARTQR